jgi:4-hydroxy-4-methyl-2-oxoglutarate aldolase
MTKRQASPDDMVERFRALPTAAVSDALDRMRLPGSALGIRSLFDGARVVGRAFTVRYAPAGHPPGTVGDYIDDVPPGAVVVLDNDGRTDCTVWGDILTSVAHERGIVGTVVSGVCRDVSKALALGYPIFSVGRFMRTGKDRVEVVEVGGPIEVGGVQVRAVTSLSGTRMVSWSCHMPPSGRWRIRLNASAMSRT